MVKGNHPLDLEGNHTQGKVTDVDSKGNHPLDLEGIHTRGKVADVEVWDYTSKGNHPLGHEGYHTYRYVTDVENKGFHALHALGLDDLNKGEIVEVFDDTIDKQTDKNEAGEVKNEKETEVEGEIMGHEAHLKYFDAFDDEDDEKNAEAPDAEGGHSLLKPHIYVWGGYVMDAVVQMQPEEQFAMGRSNVKSTAAFVKSAVVESHKTNRNKELPRHKALSPSRCPEDCMGDDIVEGRLP